MEVINTADGKKCVRVLEQQGKVESFITTMMSPAQISRIVPCSTGGVCVPDAVQSITSWGEFLSSLDIDESQFRSFNRNRASTDNRQSISFQGNEI